MLETLEDRRLLAAGPSPGDSSLPAEVAGAVAGADPRLVLHPVAPISEGAAATLSGSIANQGTFDEHQLVIDWGDPNHPVDSTFTISATASLFVGDALHSSSDDAVLVVTSIDESAGEVGFSVEHLYADDGAAPGNGTPQDEHLIRATVVDDDGNPMFLSPVNLGPTINTESVEGGSSLSPDGLTIYFHSDRPGGSGGNDLWQATRPSLDEPFGEPVNIAALNSDAHDSSTDISHDGLSLYFQSNRTRVDGRYEIYVATRTSTSEPFGDPVRLGPGVNTPNRLELAPEISPDGLTLYFQRNSGPAGFGGYDIWMATRSSAAESFGTAVNLGSTINTSYYDGGPFVTDDGLTMYFNSIRPDGFGINDIYVSTRADVGDVFGPPTILEAAINSSGQDLGAHLGSDGLYFQSDREGGYGSNDLWFAPLAGSATATVSVNNVAPTLTLNPVESINENESATLVGTLSDPGLLDEHELVVSWGDPNATDDSTFAIPAISSLVDGESFDSSTDDARLTITGVDLLNDQFSFAVSHVYDDDGPASGEYQINVAISDDDPTLRFDPPVNLGATINSDSLDGAPSLSADGLTLYFFTGRDGGFDWNIYQATRSSLSESFGPPTRLGAGVNTGVGEWDPAISSDGLSLYFTSFRADGEGYFDLYVATRESTSDPFGTAVNLGAEVNTDLREHGPAISSDGLTLYFHRTDGPQDFGDIWMATRASTSDPFGNVVKLGPNVNTSEREISPFASADDLSLLFAGSRPDGVGSTDILVSTRSAVGDQFGKPIVIGAPLNSSDLDSNPHLGPDGLYFDSTRPGGQGGFDLWFAPFAEPKVQTSVQVKNVAPTLTLNPVATINERESATLTGTITDQGLLDTHQLLIDWGDPNNGSDSTFAIPAAGGLNVNDTFSSSTDSTVLTITRVDLDSGAVGFSVGRLYADDGPAPGNFSSADVSSIAVSVADDDLGSADASVDVTVNNVRPSLVLNPVATINENEAAILTGTLTDQGLLDTHGFSIEWNDVNDSARSRFNVPATIDLNVDDTFNSFFDSAVLTITGIDLNSGAVSFSVEHVYADDGLAGGNATDVDFSAISVLAFDDDFSGERVYADVTVNNVAPTLILDPVAAINEAETATLTGTMTDPGLFDAHELAIDWDDPIYPRGSDFALPATIDLNVGDTFNSSNGNALLTIAGVDLGSGTVSFSVDHRYSDDGPIFENDTASDISSVSVSVTDDDLGGVESIAEVTVNNVAPTFTLTDGRSSESGGNLWGSIIDPGVFDSHTLVIDWDDPNNAANSTFTMPAVKWVGFGTIESSSDDAVLTVASYDRSTGELQFLVHRPYIDDGVAPGNGTASDTSVILATVTDDDLGATDATAEIIIDNVAPTLTLNSVAAINEGESATLSGAFRDRGLHDDHQLVIDWDDPNALVNSTFAIPATIGLSAGDTFSSTSDGALLTITGVIGDQVSFSVAHRYADDGLAPGNGVASDISGITATISDDDLGSDSDDVSVEIRNVAPALTLDPVAASSEGESATLTGTITDRGLLDAHELVVDWNDPNNAASSTFAIPAAAGLSVDDTFSSTSDDAALTITGVDLSLGEISFSVEHQYLDDGAAPGNGTPQDDVLITVTVIDDDTGAAAADIDLSIHNVDPVIDQVAIDGLGTRGNTALPGEQVSVSGLFSDLGVLDEHTVIVDWGGSETAGDPFDASDSSNLLDASISVGADSFSATHIYDTGGIFTITVTVIDDDTGTAVDNSLELYVSGVRVDPNTSVLQVVGTAGKDDVKVEFKKGSDGGKDKGSDGGSDGRSDGGSDGAPDGAHIKVTAKLDKGQKGSDGGSDKFFFDPDEIAAVRIVLGEGDDKAEIKGTDGKSDGGADHPLNIPTLILGDGGDDDLKGGLGPDTIFGGDGKDKIDGRDGDDNLFGGAGDDDLKGGKGNDVLSGGDGKDKLEGKQGMDLLIGGLGEDDLKNKGSDGGTDGGGDILIAGWTVYDDDPAALRTILNDAWIARFDAADDYHEIVDDLVDNWLTPGVDVFDDGDKDKLEGAKKLRDLFFADQDGHDKDDDKLKGDKGDRVVELNQLLGP